MSRGSEYVVLKLPSLWNLALDRHLERANLFITGLDSLNPQVCLGGIEEGRPRLVYRGEWQPAGEGLLAVAFASQEPQTDATTAAADTTTAAAESSRELAPPLRPILYAASTNIDDPSSGVRRRKARRRISHLVRPTRVLLLRLHADDTYEANDIFVPQSETSTRTK